MEQDVPTPGDPRIRLAGERTLLAWVRTGLAMMGLGFVVARFGVFLREFALAENFLPHHQTNFSLWIGTSLVLAGVIVNLLAAWEYYGFFRRLDRQLPYRAPRWSYGVIVAVALGIIGLAMVVYLVLPRP